MNSGTGLRFNEYSLEGLLGDGSFGTVFLANYYPDGFGSLGNDRLVVPVAMKILYSDVESLKNEAYMFQLVKREKLFNSFKKNRIAVPDLSITPEMFDIKEYCPDFRTLDYLVNWINNSYLNKKTASGDKEGTIRQYEERLVPDKDNVKQDKDENAHRLPRKTVPDIKYFYVMPYLESESLFAYVKRSGFEEMRDVLKAMIGIIDSLTVLGEAGIIHRDICPSNIGVYKEGTENINICLYDLGIALKEGDSPPESDYEVVGHMKYMSPEALFKKAPLTCKSDVYSLGLVFYFMLNPDDHIFNVKRDDLSICYKGSSDSKLTNEGARISSQLCYFPNLRNLFRKVLTFDPNDRYDTTQFREHLVDYANKNNIPL